MRKLLGDMAERVAPSLLHRRFIARHTPREPELGVLPALLAPGALAIDIGAHRGLYVHHLLAITGRVMAFEPLPRMHAYLARAFGKAIDLQPVALTDAAGPVVIRHPPRHPALAAIAAKTDRPASDAGLVEIEVPGRRLDDYALAGVAFIKIDVEGHEEAVLRGAAATLASRPNLLIECEERHCAGALDRIRRLLAGLNYNGLFIADGKVLDIAEFLPERDQRIENVSARGKTGRYINNFIFVPAARREQALADMRRLLGPRRGC